MKDFLKDLWNQPLTNREYVLLTSLAAIGAIALIFIL